MGDNFDFKTCFIVVADRDDDNDRSHRLFLRTTPEHARRLMSGEPAASSADINFVACLKWFSYLGGPQSQFVTIEMIDRKKSCHDKPIDHESPDIGLYATPLFVQHYRLEAASSNHGFRVKRMMTTSLVPLVSATICVSDDAMYRKLSSACSRSTTVDAGPAGDWTTRLLLDACRGPVICRRGDVISLVSSRPSCAEVDVEDNNDFCTVLDCEPVDQGVIVSSTSLTIVQASPPAFSRTTSSVGANDDAIFKEVESRTISRPPDYPFYLSFLAHTIRLFAVDGHRTSMFDLSNISTRSNKIKIARLLAIAYTIMQSWRLKFRIRILARNPIRIGSKLCETMDCFQVVFVPSSALRRHALTDSCWALAASTRWSSDNSANCSRTQRLVKLCSIERSAAELNLQQFGHSSDEDVCHVTPQLWFNLNAQPSTLVQPEAILFIKKYSRMRPPYARKINVSVVQSPRNGVVVDCGRILSSYFKVPRLMCQGDVFCLQVEEASLSQPQALSDGILATERYLMYFRVSKIEGDADSEYINCGYLVDREHSSLYQDGVSQSYVPNTMEDFWSSNILHPIWDSPIPVGFHRFCGKLVDTILPYFKSVSLRKAISVAICIIGPRGSGKTTAIKAFIKNLNLHVVFLNCWELIGDSAGATASRIQTALQKVTSYAPCCVVLKNVHLIGKDDSGIADGESRVVYAFKEALVQLSKACEEHPVIVIGTTTDSALLTPDLASLFLHFLDIEVCEPESRSEILRVLLSPINVGLQVSLLSLVQKTSGYVLGDLCALMNRASIAAYRRIAMLTYSGDHLMSAKEEFDLCLAGPRVINCDFDDAFAAIQSALSVAIGAPQIPSVKWEDIGGLEDVKTEILDTVQLPLQHPELLSTGMRRSGVLLYGPPGTGKTLLAKAVATECSLNFLSVKGPELINMYVGQSEENVRKIFQAARSAAPCIIFFDELDSLAPNRGRSGDSGGVMDRVVSQLLSEMDGLHCTNDVFVMGATNRPDLLDPALLRPGRLDKSLYVGISTDKSAQLKILTALTRKFHLTEDVSLVDIVNVCPSNLTGADLYALCSQALLNAISREVQQLEETGTRELDKMLSVTSQDFSLALESLSPSVSDEELLKYAAVMQKMKQ